MPSVNALVPVWLPVPEFPDYEVCARLRVRKVKTGYEISKTGGRVRLIRDGKPHYLNVRDVWAWAQNPNGHALARTFGRGVEIVWLPMPLLEAYEVSETSQVRKVATGKVLTPRDRRYAFVVDGRTYYLPCLDVLAMARDPEHPGFAKLREQMGERLELSPTPVESEPEPAEPESSASTSPDSEPEKLGQPLFESCPAPRNRGCPWENGLVQSLSEWDWAGIL